MCGWTLCRIFTARISVVLLSFGRDDDREVAMRLQMNAVTASLDDIYGTCIFDGQMKVLLSEGVTFSNALHGIYTVAEHFEGKGPALKLSPKYCLHPQGSPKQKDLHLIP